jgi:hypothetical protein
MSPVRDLPARPSLDSLRKQARKLARDSAARTAEAIARIHAQLPGQPIPVSNRDAQLVVAREYGFAGWRDLADEVRRRVDGALDRAARQAKSAIHDRDHDRLRALLAEYPALISWRGEEGGTLLAATTSYALDCSEPERERIYNRPEAAEILIDAGATVDRSTWEHVIATGASGMLHLLARKQTLPRTLPVAAALGDEEAVREHSGDTRDISRALVNACRFTHVSIALHLLDRAVAIDSDLGRRVGRWGTREQFVEFLIGHQGSHWSGGPTESPQTMPWESFVIRQVTKTIDDGDLAAFRRWLQNEPWLLDASFVAVQIAIIERSCWQSRPPFIAALLECKPALLQIAPPPPSSAIVFALEYGHADLVPALTRIWPLPDDLPHAAGTGDLAAVAGWFDAGGQPALGSLDTHFSPARDPQRREDLHWGPVSTQQVLDVALAWACVNRQFEIAAFLLDRGADINTSWSTHEPASILHECAIQGNEEAVRFLIDHAADLTIKDYRYRATAEGWARYAGHNGRIADLLAAAAQTRNSA